jgi:dipeptidyl aminopeptidase/acylaminoacyl peptidase
LGGSQRRRSLRRPSGWPLLIGQGENDGDLVPTTAIYLALQRLGKPVEARVYKGEGHVLTQKANVLDFWNRRLELLALDRR